MSPPGAARPSQEARGSGARGSQQADANPNYVRVVNPAWNGRPVMRRKDAEHYVSTGRAEWLCNRGQESDQLRLVESHPRNRAAAAMAATGYGRAAAVMIRKPEELAHVPVLRAGIALTDRSVRGAHHVAGRSGSVRELVVGADR